MPSPRDIVPELLIGAFDAVFYLNAYPDIAAAGVDPLQHYKLGGWREGRNPRADFDTSAYLAEHPAEEFGDLDPLSHRLASFLEGEAAAAIIAAAFDREFYLAANPDVARSGFDPVQHFILGGWKDGRAPRPDFDIGAYLARRPKLAECGVNPFLHYLIDKRFGIGRGDALVAPAHDEATAHFGFFVDQSGGDLTIDEVEALHEAFDRSFYLSRNPDVAAAGLDPELHYHSGGHLEGRDPSPFFSSDYYRRTYLHAASRENPLVHYVRIGRTLGYKTRGAGSASTMAETILGATRPSPDFEEVDPQPPQRKDRAAKLLALYRPNFHPFADADRWRGSGFTEWTDLPRGTPRYFGHYQPRIPRDLGFYDSSRRETIARQIELARRAGIFGFIHYYYNFNGRRLREKPLELVLADRSLDMPFALLWTNENRLSEAGAALAMNEYLIERDAQLIADLARHMSNSRYIRIAGRPLLLMSRPDLQPDAGDRIGAWRRTFQNEHGLNPLILMTQAPARAPELYGLDGAVEFPLSWALEEMRPINDKLEPLDPGFSGRVYSYAELVNRALDRPDPQYHSIKTVMPMWDDDPRAQRKSISLAGATPRRYRRWLTDAIMFARRKPFFGEPFVCIDSWNNWAEGAYLEPDIHFGGAFINATACALNSAEELLGELKILLVLGESVEPAGSPLLATIAESLARRYGAQLEWIICGREETAGLPSAWGPTIICPDQMRLRSALADAARRGFEWAFVEAAPPDDIVDELRAAKLKALHIERNGSSPTAGAVAAPRIDADAQAFELLRMAGAASRTVAAIIPNYNYENYIEGRLRSVFRQTYPLSEILFLDDASTDSSLSVAQRTASRHGRTIKILTNKRNSGNLFRQWRKGLDAAASDLVWIAEADDDAHPAMIRRLAPFFDDPDVVFAFCDFRVVDARGEQLLASYKSYYATIESDALSQRFVMPGKEFAAQYLSVKNLILNVSGVLWRRDALAQAIETASESLQALRLAGDWRLYVEACCLAGAKVGYEPASLNVHRLHGASVTSTTGNAALCQEIGTLHAIVRRKIPATQALTPRMTAYLEDLGRRPETQEPRFETGSPLEGDAGRPIGTSREAAAEGLRGD